MKGEKQQVMTAHDIDLALSRIALQIVERNNRRTGFAAPFDNESLFLLRYFVNQVGKMLPCLCRCDRFHVLPPKVPRSCETAVSGAKRTVQKLTQC